MLSEEPQPTTRSALLISSAASGEAKPPLTPRSHGLPWNRPLATAEVASSAPLASASSSRSARAPATRAPRPATNTGRAALASASVSRATASGAGAGGSSGGSGAITGGSQCAACTSSGIASTTVRRSRCGGPVGARGVGGGRAGGVQPFRHRPHRGGQRGHVDAEVGPHRRAGHVRGEHEQRRAALGRLGDAGQRVGQPRALVHGEDAHPAGPAGPGIGHARGTAFVPGGDEPGAARDQARWSRESCRCRPRRTRCVPGRPGPPASPRPPR